jgi:hypothetical protein
MSGSWSGCHRAWRPSRGWRTTRRAQQPSFETSVEHVRVGQVREPGRDLPRPWGPDHSIERVDEVDPDGGGAADDGVQSRRLTSLPPSPVIPSRACPVTDQACTSNPTNVRSILTEAFRNCGSTGQTKDCPATHANCERGLSPHSYRLIERDCPRRAGQRGRPRRVAIMPFGNSRTLLRRFG